MEDENLIVGLETSDDAAVYKINEDTAIIQTLDFFTPIVNDPYMFGQIAAANSLSDVYAMGGKPKVALNIVCFPSCLDIDVLGEILKGGADKVLEAGAVVIGGHTVDDNEPKYGLSVTGTVHPDKVLRNYGCKEGDALIITKPLGIGIVNTAIKGEIASKEAKLEAVNIMSTLNKYAGEIVAKYPVTACTDITGFGFMGHCYEMASASEVSFKIDYKNIPYVQEAKDYAEMGLVPAGAYSNKDYIEGNFEFKDVPTYMQDILFDPQTSGGLVVSCPKEVAGDMMEELDKLELKSSIIGEVIKKQDKYIIVE
ncbi:selenide, water dikinase SelD [Clostridium oceanicum]|uniref:Selenide, water dikinase n=2 Tax=Clostridium oceanicum TaxID=1543 RepID=A0ABP3V4J9_9CLOT